MLLRHCSAKRKQDFPYTHSDISRIFLLDDSKFLTDSGGGPLVSTQGGEVIQCDIDPLGGIHFDDPGMIVRPAPCLGGHGTGKISVGSRDLDSVRSLALLFVDRHNCEKMQCLSEFNSKKNANKKVLLRERKRHTARRVASTRFADGGVPPIPGLDGGGIPSSLGRGVPQVPSHPDLGRGYPGYPRPRSGWGVPHSADGENPIQSWMGRGTPGYLPPPSGPGMGYLHPDLRWGTPHPDLRRDTPCPDLRWATPYPHPDLRWGTPHPDLRWDTPCPDLRWGTPSPQSVDRLKILPSVILRMLATKISFGRLF